MIDIRVSIFHPNHEIEEIVTRQWCDVFALCNFHPDIEVVHVGRDTINAIYVHIVRKES